MSIKVGGGGGSAVVGISGATYAYPGGLLTLAAGAAGDFPLSGIIQNADGAVTVTYDAAAFSGAGGLKLLEAGTYEIELLFSPAGSGTGHINIDIQADPFNGFSDISGISMDAPFPASATSTLSILYFTGTSTPLDTVTFAVTNNTDAGITVSLSSLRVKRVGGV